MAKDPYVYPGTGVLRNNLAIHDQQELSRAEADIVRTALAVLVSRPLPATTIWRIGKYFIAASLVGSIRGLGSYEPSRSQSQVRSTPARGTSRAMPRASSPSLPGRTA